MTFPSEKSPEILGTGLVPALMSYFLLLGVKSPPRNNQKKIKQCFCTAYAYEGRLPTGSRPHSILLFSPVMGLVYHQ